MTPAQKSAVERHRRRSRQRGLVRVELQAPVGDVTLLRQIATALRRDPTEAGELRARLRQAVGGPPSGTLLEMLASDLPDAVFEEALARPREFARDVDL